MKIAKTLSLSAVVLLVTLGLAVESKAQQPSDANIGAIVLAANQIDIDYAKIALSKSKNKEVRDFAQQMITDHEAVLRSVIELAGKLGRRQFQDGKLLGEDFPWVDRRSHLIAPQW